MRSILLLLLFVSNACFAASFDCDKAFSNTEKLICTNEEISELDSKLNELYKIKIENSHPEQRKVIKWNQQKWLEGSRDKCSDIECLKHRYKVMIFRLNNLKPYDTNHFQRIYKDMIYSIFKIDNPNERNESFSTYPGGIISSCELLLIVPVGTRNGNRSYGAICKTEQGKDIRVCDDEMVGHFSVEEIDSNHQSAESLADFIIERCFGG